MKSIEIRARFLKFFENRGHKIIPSASLIPENDPSVLFNTAGMQPLVPYLLGEHHPMGKRLVDFQKCVRTGDLDDIGDNRHFSFFEMLGNWSLGDYFKEEAIKWSYEFLTSKEEGLGLDPTRLYVTVFEGDANAEKESFNKVIPDGLALAFNQYANPHSNNLSTTNKTSGSAFGSDYFELPNKMVLVLKNRMLLDYQERFFFYPSLRRKFFNNKTMTGVALFLTKQFWLPYFQAPYFVLNVEELATMWHFPGQILKVPTFERIESKDASPPTNLPR